MTIPIQKGFPPPEFDEDAGAAEGVMRRFGQSDRAVASTTGGVGPKLKNWIVNSLYPIVRAGRLINNESNTKNEAAHTDATYDWNLDEVGVLFINQTAGAALEISVDSSVDLTRLRQGRRCTVFVGNQTGVGLTVSFSADFVATSLVMASANAVAAWDFVVKDTDFGAVGTLMEIHT